MKSLTFVNLFLIIFSLNPSLSLGNTVYDPINTENTDWIFFSLEDSSIIIFRAETGYRYELSILVNLTKENNIRAEYFVHDMGNSQRLELGINNFSSIWTQQLNFYSEGFSEGFYKVMIDSGPHRVFGGPGPTLELLIPLILGPIIIVVLLTSLFVVVRLIEKYRQSKL